MREGGRAGVGSGRGWVGGGRVGRAGGRGAGGQGRAGSRVDLEESLAQGLWFIV